METIENLTFEEFQAFLLIYCAGADLEFKEEEKEIILQFIDEAGFKKVLRIYEGLNDYDRTQWLIVNKARIIKTAEDKEKLLEKMEEVFKSDGHYSVMEQNMMRMVSRFL
jgi:uncharacterized tellurite resistance protein B-like protein